MPTPKKKIMGRGESSVSVGARVGSNVSVRRGGTSKFSRDTFNKVSDTMAKDAKSGRAARIKAEDVKERMGKATKKPTKKITGK